MIADPFTMKRIIALTTFVFISFCLNAQYRVSILPRLSPDKKVYQKIAYTDVEVTYGSPRVKGRKIWGDLVPYDEIWRTGANEATNISFSDNVEIEGELLPAGKYAFFVIPQKNDKWTVIFNKNYDQWGSYSYDPADDQLRIEVLPRTSSGYNEELSFNFEQINFHYARMTLNWESLELGIEINAEFEQNLLQRTNDEIEESPVNTHWVIYLQAAEFLVNENRNPEQYFTWLKESERLSKQVDATSWNHQYYPIEFIKGHLYWTLANAYANQGDYTTCLQYVDKLMGIQGEVTFYNWENEAENIDGKVAKWRSKI